MKAFCLKVVSLILLIVFFNCSNENDLSENSLEESQISQFKINKVLSINSKVERKIAYSLLNEYEKRSIWLDKFNNLIEENRLYGVSVNLNREQKQLIKEFQKNIKVIYYTDKQSDDKEYFKNVFIPEFIEKAKTIFKDDYLVGMIFYEISVKPSGALLTDINNATIDDLVTAFKLDGSVGGNDDGGGQQTVDCNCEKGAYFSCRWGRYDLNCKNSTCTKVENDCGVGWFFDCDGKCLVV